MSAGAKAVFGLFALCLLTIAVQTWRLVGAERRVQALELAPQKQAVAVAAAKFDTAARRVDTVSRAVLRIIHDTVPVPARVLHPTTPADTQAAVAALPVLKAERDSIVRSCNRLVVTCDELQLAAKQQHQADSIYRAGLEAALRGVAPSRLGAVWNKVKLPLAFAGGLYLGTRAR